MTSINNLLIENHVAVSSLESPKHATQKNPNILSAIWFIGKRCNYSCSYCSPYLHDNYSPHIKLADAVGFIDSLAAHSEEQNKEVKITITGGEPFIHPDFLKILKHIKTKRNVVMLCVVSNGSLPFELYKQSAEYVTNLTISFHLEQPDKTISSTIEKILKLNQVKNLFLNVNLMAAPGKFGQVKNIEQIFLENSVKYITRKIDPPVSNPVPATTKKTYAEKGEDIDDYFKHKIDYKNTNNQQLDILWKEYYSQEELDYLSTTNAQTWNNIRLHTDNGYIETNTDTIKSQGLNSWQGWLCYAGIDIINIQFDGTVWRGQCMAGEPIGKLGETIKWTTNPLVCPLKYCECGSDMAARKAKNKKYIEKIDD